jgi:Rrf2 family iron-sulfur cluster assembly transcriptional regulator
MNWSVDPCWQRLRWACKASEITVADIVSVDEPIDATQCGGKENYQDDGTRCMTHDLWSSLNTEW